jgi:D-tyrosyl-tRNA(Tyr) deacylase
MRVIIQRVLSSSVLVEGKIVGKIGRGLNLLVGFTREDTRAEIEWMVRKCLESRLFSADLTGESWEKSVLDIGGEIIVVSQFTLYGDCRKGRRPSFSEAAKPMAAESLYNFFVAKLRESGLRVETGKFGAKMQVNIENDGPVTLLLEKTSDRG